MTPNKPLPPRWAEKFLAWYCRPELLEEIQGDIYELFEKRCQELGGKRARRRFIWDVFRSFRLSTIKQVRTNPSAMLLRNNFKIAWRQLLKQKMFGAIKIGGFALGVAACLLISLYIKDETSYDQHYPNANNIYRLLGVNKQNGVDDRGVHFAAPMARVLEQDYPEVLKAGRYLASPLFGARSTEVRREDRQQNTHEDGFMFADQKLLEIFQPKMHYGELKTALSKPNTLVLSKSKADYYFPDEDPVGKVMILNNEVERPYTVGGVMEDFPKNSHLHEFHFFRTLTEVEFWENEQSFWFSPNYHVYLELQPGVDLAAMEDKFMGVLEDYLLPILVEAGVPDANKLIENGSFQIQPIADVHLNSNGVPDRLEHGDIRFVWLFGGVAFFILIIAAINFINLSTARSANRAKEVGLRKVVGSERKNLISQFLTESILFSSLSFILGALLAYTILPYFNALAGKSLVMPWLNPIFIALLAGSALVVGVFAGIYPAIYLSGFKPINVLKGALSQGSKNARMQSGLVVFQFTTSIILIIGTAVIHRQMQYILNKKLGFDKEQVLLLRGAHVLDEKVATLKEVLLQNPEVESVAVSDFLPVTGTKRNGNQFWEEGRENDDNPTGGERWEVDHDYIKTMGMNIVAGRDFSLEMPTDSQAVIINESMVRALGLEDPIGKRIINSGWISWPIIGVVEDFHFESLKQKIEPLVMTIGASTNTVSVKVQTEDMSGTIASVKGIWDEISPNQPIRYTFLDQDYEQMYEEVQRMESIFTSFAILAIIVACLGLFALSAFMAEQRRKEIGIRKVLGASLNNLLQLLTQHFVILVTVSFMIAVPLAWYLMRRWLQDYAYPTPISWTDFIFSGLITLFIALFTVGFQAVRAALSNPVEAIRSE